MSDADKFADALLRGNAVLLKTDEEIKTFMRSVPDERGMRFCLEDGVGYWAEVL
jgi:hypothetical protein